MKGSSAFHRAKGNRRVRAVGKEGSRRKLDIFFKLYLIFNQNLDFVYEKELLRY